MGFLIGFSMCAVHGNQLGGKSQPRRFEVTNCFIITTSITREN